MQKQVIIQLDEESSRIILILVDSKNYQRINIELVKNLLKKNYVGVYVTLNKPFDVLFNSFKNNKIDPEMLIFIDAVTLMTNYKHKKHEHCLFLENPSDLSDISMAMNEAINSLTHKKKFILIDSLNTLLLYSKPDVVVRFLHFVIGKMRDWNVKGIIISLKEDTDQRLLSEISQFCDSTISIKGGKNG